MPSDVVYPEQRHMQALTLVRRERLLPDGAIGRVEVANGSRVSFRDVIAVGELPSPYTLLEGAALLRLRRPEALVKHMRVGVDEEVDEGQVLAQRRRRRVLAPVSGRVVQIGEGRIILQARPQLIELESGMNGSVVEVRPGRGAVIETIGAVLQGVWGNGRRALGAIRMEPGEGMETIRSDQINNEFRGSLLVTRRPLTRARLPLLTAQEFAGVIAPSADAAVLAALLALKIPVLLTEGFGEMRMSATTASFLDDMDGRQATLDAVTPGSGEMRRPEIVVTIPIGTIRPTAPPINMALGLGSTVRVARGGQTSVVGQVVEWPRGLTALENGLYVPCAVVEFVTGERTTVPLANLELSG